MPPTEQPKTRAFAPTAAYIGSGVLLLAVLGLGAFLLMRPASAPAMPNQGAEAVVAWKQPAFGTPVKRIPGDGLTYDIYDIGTLESGTYAGSDILLAVMSYADSSGDGSGVDTQVRYGEYFYFIGDADGTPKAWWNRPAALVSYQPSIPAELNLTSLPEAPSADFPNELPDYVAGPIRDSAGQKIGFNTRGLVLPRPSDHPALVPGVTVDGNPLVTLPLQYVDKSPLAPANGYYVSLPYGLLAPAVLVPDFMQSEAAYGTPPPHITWSEGSTSVARYNFGAYAYGWYDCFSAFADVASVVASLKETGKSEAGDPLFEVRPDEHPDVYKCLYLKTERYDYDPATGQSTGHYPLSYDEFITTHPLFFWKHPYAGYMAFVREDVVPAAEKAKPVIYLYPEKEEQVHVEVAPAGGFTKTDPVYRDGWDALARPDGRLTVGGTDYPYLFWEGGNEGVTPTPEAGFIAAREDVPALLDDKLSVLGLSAKERADFISFWAPKLSKAPYYFITFVSREDIDRTAPLSVSPAPDTVIRVLMDYRPLAAPEAVQPLTLTPATRSGFTVVEWGGVIRD